MRFRFVTAVLAMAAALFGVPTPSASATPVSAQACTESIRSAQYITFLGRPVVHNPPNYVGAVQLRKDTCGNYWAYVKIYHTLGIHQMARGWISRWDNGQRTVLDSCFIGAGGTECVTPKIRSANSASLFLASAHYYIRNPETREWEDSHWGQTATVR